MIELTLEDLCVERPWRHLSACLLERDHAGPCIFAKALRGDTGRGGVAAVNFYRRGRGATFHLETHADLEHHPARLGRLECAALWAIAATQRKR
jgi:hypothetical protein